MYCQNPLFFSARRTLPPLPSSPPLRAPPPQPPALRLTAQHGARRLGRQGEPALLFFSLLLPFYCSTRFVSCPRSRSGAKRRLRGRKRRQEQRQHHLTIHKKTTSRRPSQPREHRLLLCGRGTETGGSRRERDGRTQRWLPRRTAWSDQTLSAAGVERSASSPLCCRRLPKSRTCG